MPDLTRRPKGGAGALPVPREEAASAPLRLQVYLSRAGICSRRRAFDLVLAGKVSVNGRVVREPSTQIAAGRDVVEVEGRSVGGKSFQYVLINKPAGVTTTKSDRHAERTVMDLLPKEWRHLHPVGRLDKDTEGLLLLTNDGDLTNHLTHPRFNVDKIYEVAAKGELTPAARRQLEQGVVIEGKKTSPAEISRLRVEKGQSHFQIQIHEGRKRQIRRMLGKVGFPVVFLRRIQQGPLRLGGLQAGQIRPLTTEELVQLRKLKVGTAPTFQRDK